MPIPTASDRLTASEFAALPDSEDYEFLSGRLLRREKGNRVAWITGNLAAKLADFVDAHQLGWVFTSPAGFILDRAFATVLRPSVSFVRLGRLTNETPADALDQLAPDLAVEVISPRDKVLELDAKIDASLSAGVREFWVINPVRRNAKIYQPDGTNTVLRQVEELDGGGILPGFRCRVADLVILPTPTLLQKPSPPVSDNGRSMQPSNPFGDKPEAANPYSSPTGVTVASLASTALFLPALFLLLSSGFSALYMVATLAMVLAPQGPFSGDAFASTRVMMVVSYATILVVSLICVAGAIAMLRMRGKWLAWTASILSLLPLFGPCLGLTIPLGIWALVVLRRPEVDASFVS